MDGTRRYSRRRFLGAAAAAAAGPFVVPSRVLGRRSGESDAVAPSDRVGVAFIGCGRRGYVWVSSMARMAQVRAVAVCDVSERGRQSGLKYARRGAADCRAFEDFREVLALEEVDAVVIATPDHWHGVMAVAAAKAGKDVFLEAPLALTFAEAQAVCRAAERYGRVVQVGTDRRSHGGYVTATDIVRGGALGQVRTVYVQAGPPSRPCFLRGSDRPRGLNWEMWLGPAPWAEYHPYRCSSSMSYGWRAWRDYCGGQLAWQGGHYFDLVHWALGLDGSGPVEVLPPDGKDVRMLTFRYADGLTVYGGKGPKGAAIEMVGTAGTLAIGLGEELFRTWPESIGIAARAAARQAGGRSRSASRYYTSLAHVTDWLDAVRTRRRCVSHPAAARRSGAVWQLGCIATWLGRALRWDPAKEQILGDPAATRWLRRPLRAPWRA